MSAKTNRNQNHFPKKVPTISSGKLTSKIIIKDDYVRADGKCSLYLQIFLNGKRKRINLDLQVPPEFFDKTKMRIKKAYPNSRDLNLVIEKTLGDLNQIEVFYRLTNAYLTVEDVAKELKNPSSRLDFIKYWEEQLEIDAKHLAESTVRSSRNVLNKVKSYREVILFRDLSADLILDLCQYLKKSRKNSQNTLFNVTKNIRKYLKKAEKAGISTPISYRDIPHKKVKSDIDYLEKEEVQKLWEYYNGKYVPEIYKSVLAKFLFSCMTGLRISDMLSLESDNFMGDYLVKFMSKKSRKLQKIKLNVTAKKIYADGFLLHPPHADQTINRKLKEIAYTTEIPKNLHFHMARHSFATNFLKEGGRIEVLQKLLAHSSIRDTMTYVHVVEEDMNKEIYLLDNLFDNED